jgi:hypothetical protein
MTEKLEKLITYAIADGVITDKEREILLKSANEEGLDIDQFEMILNAKLHEKQTEISIQNKTIILPPPPLENPKSNKEGALKKCPSCGASVQSFQLNCSECGHEFRNTRANEAVKDLESKIASLKGQESDLGYKGKLTAIIRNYPIPTNKDDLFEMLTYMSSKVLSSSDVQIGGDELTHAYKGRALEIISKLHFMEGINPSVIERINEIEKKMTNHQKKSNRGSIIMALILLPLSIGLFYFFFWIIKSLF